MPGIEQAKWLFFYSEIVLNAWHSKWSTEVAHIGHGQRRRQKNKGALFEIQSVNHERFPICGKHIAHLEEARLNFICHEQHYTAHS